VTVDVEIAGHSRRVELEQTADGWKATIDGRSRAVDVVPVAGRWSILVGPPEGGHHDFVAPGGSRTSYDVSVSERVGGELTVYVDGVAFEARAIDPRVYRRRGPGARAAANLGVRQVVAPMPGRVVKVLVKPGDRVTARQGLVVVEAMKMENELRAPADAVVRDVLAIEGASVDSGTVLVVLE
jgi:biotin carboxyl carrier protein